MPEQQNQELKYSPFIAKDILKCLNFVQNRSDLRMASKLSRAILNYGYLCMVKKNEKDEIEGVVFPDVDLTSDFGKCTLHLVLNKLDFDLDFSLKTYLAFVFSKGFNKIVAQVPLVFRNLCKQYESVGFIQEGLCRQEYCIKGKFYDMAYYGLLREDFNG